MNYIAYYRVSTKKQELSGLGLDAQKAIIHSFTKGENVISEYTDIESGTLKGNNRPELLKALRDCRANSATLVIAKLDRLARNVHFTTTIMESGVNFIACDMPQANKFTIHIFAALAEQEADLISKRTKEALHALKKTGKRLGNPNNLTLEARKKGIQSIINKAVTNDNNKRAISIILLLNEKGVTLNNIANQLNIKGFKSSRGKKFHAVQVKRLLERSEYYS